MKLPKAILFDYGDTLIKILDFDTRRGNEHLLSMAENPFNVTVDDLQAYAMEIRNEVFELREQSCIEFSIFSFHRLLYERFHLKLPVSLEEMELEFWKNTVKCTPEDGIDELLDFLQSKNIKMGIVSNTSNHANILSWQLDQFGLLDKFDFLMASIDYGFRKPHPLFFKTAIAKTRFEPEDIWFAGNSFEHDIKGALGVGLKAIWYNRAGITGKEISPQKTEKIMEIKSWWELLNKLKL